jgi:hypothetical protein
MLKNNEVSTVNADLDSKFLLIRTLVAIVTKELHHSLVLMNLQIGSFLQQNDEEA